MWRRLADWCVPAEALALGPVSHEHGPSRFRVHAKAGTVVWLQPGDDPNPTPGEVAAGEQLARLIGAPRWRVRWRPGRRER